MTPGMQWPEFIHHFELRLVTGIESSAMHSFTQIKRAADELGARLVLVNLSPDGREQVVGLKFRGDLSLAALLAGELADELGRVAGRERPHEAAVHGRHRRQCR